MVAISNKESGIVSGLLCTDFVSFAYTHIFPMLNVYVTWHFKTIYSVQCSFPVFKSAFVKQYLGKKITLVCRLVEIENINNYFDTSSAESTRCFHLHCMYYLEVFYYFSIKYIIKYKV